MREGHQESEDKIRKINEFLSHDAYARQAPRK
jgi:hypothetical protein